MPKVNFKKTPLASALSSYCDPVQTAVSLLETTQIISGVPFITTHIAYAITKTKQRCASLLRLCLDAMLLPWSY